uniref:Uncharacterized protein n=1 Tax=Setaria italica TaxID=4555 RepID=K3ZBC1_SETIT
MEDFRKIYMGRISSSPVRNFKSIWQSKESESIQMNIIEEKEDLFVICNMRAFMRRETTKLTSPEEVANHKTGKHFILKCR